MHKTNATMHCGAVGWDDNRLALCSGGCINFYNCNHVSGQILANANAIIHYGAVGWDDNHFSTL